MSIWSDTATLFAALASQDSFEIRGALRANSTYLIGAVFLAVAGWIMAWIYHRVPLFERYFERTVMVTSYLTIAFIIFWGVVDRFVFSNQQPWSTTIPPLLFMIMA
ncbi:MAG: TRAP transporter small permease, partial [Pseudomonadota bacterium]